MPFKTKHARALYQRRWENARREAWIRRNGPCVVCGSIEQLQVDHINPMLKITHRVWSWSKLRMEAELKKCQVLCVACHRDKTAKNKDVETGKLRKEIFGKASR